MAQPNDPSVRGTRAKDELRRKGEDLREDVREMGEVAREAAREAIEDARRRGADYYETGREHALEYEEQFEGYIRENPLKAVLIAAGVGLLVGAILRR